MVRRSLMASMEYNQRGSHALRPHVAELVNVQDPDAFFPSPALGFPHSGPISHHSSGLGDLFTVRNVG